jgi:hypothetical protein
MGCIIGDHVKTAICTRINTGATLHTGAMVATSAAAGGNIPHFAWCTDEHPPGSKTFRPEKFVEIARVVMGRRKVSPSAAYLERLRELYSRGPESPEKNLEKK